jgi:hypothetical protein
VKTRLGRQLVAIDLKFGFFELRSRFDLPSRSLTALPPHASRTLEAVSILGPNRHLDN